MTDARTKSERLVSLDQFRGYTVAGTFGQLLWRVYRLPASLKALQRLL